MLAHDRASRLDCDACAQARGLLTRFRQRFLLVFVQAREFRVRAHARLRLSQTLTESDHVRTVCDQRQRLMIAHKRLSCRSESYSSLDRGLPRERSCAVKCARLPCCGLVWDGGFSWAKGLPSTGTSITGVSRWG